MVKSHLLEEEIKLQIKNVAKDPKKLMVKLAMLRSQSLRNVDFRPHLNKIIEEEKLFQ